MSMSDPTTDHTTIRTWACLQGMVPVEQLPSHIDGEPGLLRLVHSNHAENEQRFRKISWEEFFLKFDNLGLVLVYDQSEDSTGDNEILQPGATYPYLDDNVPGPDLGN
jgi:hypothetical protein